MKTNEVHVVPILLSLDELDSILVYLDSVPKTYFEEDKNLGRLILKSQHTYISGKLEGRLNTLITEMAGKSLRMVSAVFVEYNSKYGSPNLPPHFDGDKIEVIIDYQLSSNTRWPLGVNTSTYDLENNSALVFNPNTNIHWRPHKTFKAEEYVRMLFFRFESSDPKEIVDYSYLPNDSKDPVFEEVRDYRESLGRD